tara:strand:+ start:56 stop:763 length:708 start_codon:yes stop_codon:yes gene_type:complete
MKLLNTNASNTKIMKTQKGTEYEIASLSLMPDSIICPSQIIAKCKEPCLVWAGRGQMHSVARSRQSKSDLWHSDKSLFLETLTKEMAAFITRCNKREKLAAFRLNTISDIPWEKYGIPQLFPQALLYDYTKLAARLGRTPENYKLMFSFSAAPAYQNQVKSALKTNVPISAVFRGGLPKTYLGRPVIDGDKSDLVNLYSGASIIGLKLKGGKAIQESKSPFIVDNPELIELARAA